MNQRLAGVTGSLRRAADTLGDAAAGLDRLDPGLRAFGGDGPGRLGELGRDLHDRWQRALDARMREAAAHAARLEELAAAVVRAAAGYAETDEAARRRQPEVRG